MIEVPIEIREWEGGAEEVLDSTCTSAPVSALSLAAATLHRLEPDPGVDEAERRGDVIVFNPSLRETRKHMRIAHELGHYTCERHGLEDTEDAARYIGGALLLPRRSMTRDLVETAWSIRRLREKHIYASATAIAIRITQLRDAVVTVFHMGMGSRRKPWRRLSPWIVADRHLERPTRFERELAQRALDASVETWGDELCYALPIVEGSYKQVIVVCELEQLSLRL